MKVLTLNCGSSSVKYGLLDMPAGTELCHGIVERVTQAGSFARHSQPGKKESVQYHDCPNHNVAIEFVISYLTNPTTGAVKDLSEIGAVGHRVVHGGEKYAKSVVIDGKVIRDIEEYCELAPLHNPANLAGIHGAMRLLPKIPHIAIFDTAFLTTLPPHVYIYPLPYEWYEKHHIRRYGFHGSSHFYVSRKAAFFLNKAPNALNLITLHIGNGVSITAIKNGAAYDHSMGFTPLEGAVMGTRCGDIDPAIPLYVMKKEKIGAPQMENILNRESGLLGISGKYSDRREILKAMEHGEKRATLAFDIECYRLRKYIGSYMASLGRVDAIVFTGGVGENSSLHRLTICEGLEFMGIEIDRKKNEKATGGQKEMEISTPSSKIKLLVIPTNEEVVLAEDAWSVIGKN